MLSSCSTKPKEEVNPLLTEFDTPYNVPPFDLIETKHYMPAFEEAFARHNEEIEAIVNNEESPTFENTVEALEYAGGLLTQTSRIFYNLNAAHTSEEMQTLAQELSPKMTQHYDNIILNKPLFERIQAVYKNKDQIELGQEQKVLLEETYKSFIRGGAALNDEDQEKLREINKKLATKTLTFGQNVLAETNNFKLFIDNEEDLSGIPQDAIETAYEAAKAEGKEGKWLFTVHNPSVMPFLHYADNRALREKMKTAFVKRGNNGNEHDNNEIIKEIVNLRIQRAHLLGYETHADFVLEENMVNSIEGVYDLLETIWPPALDMVKKEAYDLQALADEMGHELRIKPWDWRYYTELLRKEKYDLDEEELRAYFELENVKNGIFTLCHKLWGITFEPNENIPVYHPDVVAYEVFEEDGSFIGVLYMDFHPRASKRSGAWMTSYRQQHITKDGTFVYPVISIVCNFTAPTANMPSLLTFDEARTFFHEFGHALHGLFSNCQYYSLSGTSVARDFVELPSQIMENWMPQPEVLKLFAKHYETGEVIPDELIEKIQAATYFNQGFRTVEFLASAFLDMAYYTRTEPLTEWPVDFENNVRDDIGIIDEIHFRHRSTHFQHIFSGGYSAGYYSYIWSEVLDADAFEAFKENGLFDRETAQSFRENILERGKTDDPMTLYVNFRGAEPKIEPLLRNRGLLR